jgi:predicted CXXCH cytochrome family protein
MKKLMLLLLVVGLAAPAVMALNATALDAADTSHSSAFGCGACHDAHNRNLGAVSDAPPLWGRAANTTTSLTAYTLQSTLRGALTIPAPSGSSLLCMACHDGVTDAGTDAHQINGTSDDGYVNTATMHPISFDYDTFADATSGAGKDYFNDSAGTGVIGDVKLFNGKLECGSCHDIHGATNPNDGTANTDALRGDGTGQDLCIDCHVN